MLIKKLKTSKASSSGLGNNQLPKSELSYIFEEFIVIGAIGEKNIEGATNPINYR
jgi:hypothetical protein